jgi:hypothetical protein
MSKTPKNVKTRNNFPPVFAGANNYNAESVAKAKWKAYLNKLKYSPEYGLTIANIQKLAALNTYWRNHGHTPSYNSYKHVKAIQNLLNNRYNNKFVQNLLTRYGIRIFMPPHHQGGPPSVNLSYPAGTYTVANMYVNNLARRRRNTIGKPSHGLRTRVAGMTQPPWPNVNKPARMQRGINATREGLQRILNHVRRKLAAREMAQELKRQFEELEYLRRTYGPNKRLKIN